MKDLIMIQLETTNLCQASCKFCPHDKFKEFGTMTDKLYESIVNQAGNLPKLTNFIPMLTGEPFCDKKIIERIKYARARMPWVNIELYTNGNLLTFAILQQLKEIPNFALSISLNGLNPEVRKEITGLDDWPHVIRMCRYAEQIKLPYRVTMVAYPEIKEQEIKGFVQAGGSVIQYQSWAGQQYPYKRNRWTSCMRALNYMTIRYTGDVCLCCFDAFGKVNFGNLNRQTIEEVWNSPYHRELQELHKRGEGNKFQMCDSCTEG